MTDQQHPITPPPHLRQLWVQQAHRIAPHDPVAWQEHVANQAAQWGANQELEACCEWLLRDGWAPSINRLRAARRPKPKRLAEEGLYALDEAMSSDCIHLKGIGDTIRRALERLQELEGQQ